MSAQISQIQFNSVAEHEAIKVRKWRTILQRIFLSSSGKFPLEEKDMPSIDRLFTEIECYDKMSIEYLAYSKIGKLMRHISALPDDRIPRDDEFRFRERGSALVERWAELLQGPRIPRKDLAPTLP